MKKQTIIIILAFLITIAVMLPGYLCPAARWERITVSTFESSMLYTTKTNVTTAGFNTEQKGIALYYNDSIFMSSDSGKKWSRAQKDKPAMYLTNLEIYKHCAWVSGGNNIKASSDYGKTWKTLPIFGRKYQSALLSFCNEKDGWNACTGNLAVTNDGGHTWRTVTGRGFNDIQAICILNKQTGYVLDNYTIYKTKNNGKSWTTVLLPPEYRNLEVKFKGTVNALRFKNELCGTLVLYKETPSRTLIVLQTTDGGKTWTREQSPFLEDVMISSIYLSHDRTLLTVCDTINNKIVVFRQRDDK